MATTALSFTERAARDSNHPLASYLYRLMAIKETNLCVSADVNSTTALLRLAEEVGDHICVLKTHADIVDDFGERTIRGLQDVARRKHFLLFEDRKFGDIGSTVEQQYTRGPIQIAAWAHIVNAHLLPGPGIVTALRNGAHLAENRLAKSVSTEIFVGTPEISEDDDDGAVAGPGTLRVSTDTTPGASAAVSSPPNGSTPGSPTGDGLSQRGSVRATTTIYQTYDDSTTSATTAAAAAAAAAGLKASAAAADRTLALQRLGPAPLQRGLLLFAQMSSEGNRMDAPYTAACVSTARANRDFVLGFISQESLNGEAAGDNFLCLTPGVNLPPPGRTDGDRATGDGKGQRYRSPAEVIGRDGCDIVIVGRGILKANNRRNEAERYQAEAWKAYLARLEKK